MRSIPLRRLVASLDNGAWGEEAVGDGDVGCVRAADFDFERLRVSPRRLPSRHIDRSLARRLRLSPGDLVLEKSGGGDQLPVGRVVLFDLDEHAIPTNFAARLRPVPTVNSRFLVYALAAHYWAGATARCIKQTTGIQNLDTDAWLKTPTPYPSVEHQRRIADFLDDQVARLDSIASARERQMTLVHARLGRQVEKALLDGGERAGGDPWFAKLPDGWSIAPLASNWLVVDCKHRTPTYVDDGYPVISPGDINAGRLDLSVATRFVGLADYMDLADDARRCRQGDLVYSRNASVGVAAYVGESRPFTMGQDVCRITSVGDQLFLMYVLNHLMQPQLEAYSVGSTFTRINVARIKSLRVPLPPTRVQDELAAECDRLTIHAKRLEMALQASIDLLQERKRALITAAVTGEFDVTTASGRGVA